MTGPAEYKVWIWNHLSLKAKAETPLSERERAILAARFGEPKKTLRVLGEEYGVTFERIRQIEIRSLRKMQRWEREHRG